MSNFFFSESEYSFAPVIKSVDKSIVERDLLLLREKIVDYIKQQIEQKELSKSEISFATRMPRPLVSLILKGRIEKISTDRLLRVARSLGLKPQIKFKAENT